MRRTYFFTSCMACALWIILASVKGFNEINEFNNLN